MGKFIHEHVHTIQSPLFIFWNNSLVYIYLGSMDTKKACPCLNMDASDTAACVSSENNNNNFLNFGHMMANKKKDPHLRPILVWWSLTNSDASAESFHPWAWLKHHHWGPLQPLLLLCSALGGHGDPRQAHQQWHYCKLQHLTASSPLDPYSSFNFITQLFFLSPNQGPPGTHYAITQVNPTNPLVTFVFFLLLSSCEYFFKGKHFLFNWKFIKKKKKLYREAI